MKASKLTQGHNLRWESSRMMLPEHVDMLNELAVERTKVDKPIIDDQQKQEFAQAMSDAKVNNQRIKISIWKEGFFEDFVGYLNNIDPYLKRIRLDINESEVAYINIVDIVGVEARD